VGLVLAWVALALWVHRRSLGLFFGPDDFILLERATGLLPPLHGLWRVLAGPAYFGAAAPLFGTDPRPYHVVSWMLHG
jgi:hypothetical protein